MTSIPKSLVKHFSQSRSLVTITRERIDSNDIHGFIVDYDDQWILLKREYDFHIDGWLLLRIADISALKSTPTNEFQKALLEEEGLLDRVDFAAKIPEGGVRHLLDNFDRRAVIILEDEIQNDLFVIGFIDEVTQHNVSVDFITGIGQIDDEKSVLDIESITSITYDSNYSLFYQRYFERHQKY
ncbi:hypothetical protein [Persicirhabdus sediminis]|uniref:Uncharacterized protein n=1 Tax=Persicirhabdus sediminis TaxID=454144 RepID=A0A8J7SNI9_9BACT|nr:hypothetical protein [Persicirhabdus sediminis]MBK1791703.1 hypothetical protein [Persicirhabdus sediminis]